VRESLIVLNAATAHLLLLEITLTNSGTPIRLVRNTANVTYDGNEYTAFAMELGEIPQELRGEIPHVSLRLGNATRVLEPYLHGAGGLIGASVRVMLVQSDLLSDPPDMDVTFIVNRATSTATWITLDLSLGVSLAARFPADRYIPNYCRHVFRGNACTFAGTGIVAQKTIAFVDGGAGADTITDSAEGFITGGLASRQLIKVSGSALNDGMYEVVTATAGTLTLATGTLTSESAGAEVTITTECDHTIIRCAANNKIARFGGAPGMAGEVYT